VRAWSDETETPNSRMLGWISVGASKFHDWKRFGESHFRRSLQRQSVAQRDRLRDAPTKRSSATRRSTKPATGKSPKLVSYAVVSGKRVMNSGSPSDAPVPLPLARNSQADRFRRRAKPDHDGGGSATARLPG
jgi:hypothetical protein